MQKTASILTATRGISPSSSMKHLDYYFFIGYTSVILISLSVYTQNVDVFISLCFTFILYIILIV